MTRRQVHRILVPLDGSELSERALSWAETLAGPSGARITLLQVVPSLTQVVAATSAGTTPVAAETIVDPAEQVDAAKRAARDDLERARHQITSDGDMAIVVEEGSSGDAIVRRAEEDGVDLIVMSTRGQGGLIRAVLGSVADHVVRHARCPVLLIPARAAR